MQTPDNTRPDDGNSTREVTTLLFQGRTARVIIIGSDAALQGTDDDLLVRAGEPFGLALDMLRAAAEEGLIKPRTY